MDEQRTWNGVKMYRVEDKYFLSGEELYLMEKRMGSILNYDGYSHEERGYKISSLYFDDICDTCLADTIDGNSQRDKYRIRIYEDSFDVVKLEVKSKYYNRTQKRTVNISRKEMKRLCCGECIGAPNDLGNPRTAFNIAILTRKLSPKVIVTYERKAYVYETGNVRITFDYNIRGSNQINLFGDGNLIYDFPKDYDSVLEVKYDEFLPDFIAAMLEMNSMQQISNSKYRICREIYK